jgi:hypothetical protein
MVFSRSIFEKRINMSAESDAFEVRATKYLNDSIKITHVIFEREGASNGWTGDIKVLYKGKLLFWVSAKLPSSQGGQITVEKDVTGNYVLTKDSHDPVRKNIVTQEVIDHLNNDLAYYSIPTSKSIIFKNSHLITDWVHKQCIAKKEIFMIFEDKHIRKNIHVIPSCFVHNIFNISGSFRIKFSGPQRISDKMTKHPFYTREDVVELAIKHLNLLGIEVILPPVVKKHTVLNLNKSRLAIVLEKDKYFGDNFYISFKEPSEHQVRLVKISRPDNPNPNVMAVFKLKRSICIPTDGLDLLKKCIELKIK